MYSVLIDPIQRDNGNYLNIYAITTYTFEHLPIRKAIPNLAMYNNNINEIPYKIHSFLNHNKIKMPLNHYAQQ